MITARRTALVLRGAALCGLALAVVAAVREVVLTPRTWALDALAWAAVVQAAQVAVLAWAWNRLGRASWAEAPAGTAMRSFAAGWVARYVPGPPTGPAGKFLALREASLPADRIGVLLWMEQALQLGAAVVVPALLVVPALGREWLPAALAGLVVGLAVALGGARPATVRWVARRLGRRGGGPEGWVAPADAGAAFVGMATATLLAGLAFHITAVVVSDWPLGRWVEGTLAFCVASLIGYLAPFAPAGAGVRESVLVAVLGSQVGSANALVAAVAARATAVVVDGAFVGGYYGAMRLPAPWRLLLAAPWNKRE